MKSKMKKVTKTALIMVPKWNYVMLRSQRNRRWLSPSRKRGTPLGYLTNELRKSFPVKNDDRDNEIPLRPVQSRKPELQSNGPQSFDCRAVSFSPATVKTIKEILLNVIIIEKNFPTSLMMSPGLWGNMAWDSSL